MLVLGNLEPAAYGSPNRSPFSFHPFNDPSKAKTQPIFTAVGTGPPILFSSESKVLQLAKRVLRVRPSSLHAQRECFCATPSEWPSPLEARCVFWDFRSGDRYQGACYCKSGVEEPRYTLKSEMVDWTSLAGMVSRCSCW